jgi:hypothetical protein
MQSVEAWIDVDPDQLANAPLITFLETADGGIAIFESNVDQSQVEWRNPPLPPKLLQLMESCESQIAATHARMAVADLRQSGRNLSHHFLCVLEAREGFF